MSQEIELKLAVLQEKINTVKNHPLWQELSATSPKTLQLGNTYFDIADLKLNQARAALKSEKLMDVLFKH